MKNNIKNSRGYTLVEALIYIALFVIISTVIVGLLLSVLETNKQVSPLNSLSRGAISALEVITREIRGAKSIDILSSDFATTTGSLQLETLDAAGGPRVVKFYLDAGVVKVSENGAYVGPLSSSDVVATALTFNIATSTTQNLIKSELEATAGSGKYVKSEKFYTSVGLRVEN